MAALLLNDYDPETKFYKFVNAEEKIREWGERFPDTYHISLFACCRQKLSFDKYNFISLDMAKREYAKEHNTEYQQILKQPEPKSPVKVRKLKKQNSLLAGRPINKKERDKKKKTEVTKEVVQENTCLIFGTSPKQKVLGETKMVENLLTHIKNKQDPKYQSVEFPSVLDQIKTDDAEFELSISNTIAKL